MRLALHAVSQNLAGRKVLHAISFSVAGGERIALIGPNGAGKSTLLRRMAGLMQGEGAVLFDDRPVGALDAMARARAIAYLPQEKRIAWGISVEALIGLARLPHGMEPDAPRLSDIRAIDAVLARFSLDDWRHRPATSLSGGEQARVLLARAMAVEAPLLLADEPVAALDPRQQYRVLDALSRYAAEGRSVVAVFHDIALALRWASRILILDNGALVADDAPDATLIKARLETSFGLSARFLDDAGTRHLLLLPSAALQNEDLKMP